MGEMAAGPGAPVAHAAGGGAALRRRTWRTAPARGERTRCDRAEVVERLQHLERLIRDMLMFARGECSGARRSPWPNCWPRLAQTFEPLARRREASPFIVTDDSAVVRLSRQPQGARRGADQPAGKRPRRRCATAAHRARRTARRQPVLHPVRDNGRGMDAETAGAPVRALLHHPRRGHRTRPGHRPRRRPRPRRRHRSRFRPRRRRRVH
jgi:two-component system sensor histidine kinase FlrB